MFTVIVCEAVIGVMGMAMVACAAAGLYIAKCDESVRENMGVRI